MEHPLRITLRAAWNYSPNRKPAVIHSQTRNSFTRRRVRAVLDRSSERSQPPNAKLVCRFSNPNESINPHRNHLTLFFPSFDVRACQLPTLIHQPTAALSTLYCPLCSHGSAILFVFSMYLLDLAGLAVWSIGRLGQIDESPLCLSLFLLPLPLGLPHGHGHPPGVPLQCSGCVSALNHRKQCQQVNEPLPDHHVSRPGTVAVAIAIATATAIAIARPWRSCQTASLSMQRRWRRRCLGICTTMS